MKRFIMYERDEKNRPVVTRCLLFDGRNFAFGQALCSKKDNPCKKISKAIAEGRAKKALNQPLFFSEFARAGKTTFFKAFNDALNVPSRLKYPEIKWMEKNYG